MSKLKTLIIFLLLLGQNSFGVFLDPTGDEDSARGSRATRTITYEIYQDGSSGSGATKPEKIEATIRVSDSDLDGISDLLGYSRSCLSTLRGTPEEGSLEYAQTLASFFKGLQSTYQEYKCAQREPTYGDCFKGFGCGLARDLFSLGGLVTPIITGLTDQDSVGPKRNDCLNFTQPPGCLGQLIKGAVNHFISMIEDMWSSLSYYVYELPLSLGSQTEVASQAAREQAYRVSSTKFELLKQLREMDKESFFTYGANALGQFLLSQMKKTIFNAACSPGDIKDVTSNKLWSPNGSECSSEIAYFTCMDCHKISQVACSVMGKVGGVVAGLFTPGGIVSSVQDGIGYTGTAGKADGLLEGIIDIFSDDNNLILDPNASESDIAETLFIAEQVQRAISATKTKELEFQKVHAGRSEIMDHIIDKHVYKPEQARVALSYNMHSELKDFYTMVSESEDFEAEVKDNALKTIKEAHASLAGMFNHLPAIRELQFGSDSYKKQNKKKVAKYYQELDKKISKFNQEIDKLPGELKKLITVIGEVGVAGHKRSPSVLYSLREQVFQAYKKTHSKEDYIREAGEEKLEQVQELYDIFVEKGPDKPYMNKNHISEKLDSMI